MTVTSSDMKTIARNLASVWARLMLAGEYAIAANIMTAFSNSTDRVKELQLAEERARMK